MKYLIVFLVTIQLSCFTHKIKNNENDFYSSFDEYSLVPLNKISDVESYGNRVLSTQTKNDSLIVTIYDDKNIYDVVYVNKGMFWYNEFHENFDNFSEDSGVDTTFKFSFEKYIYNDTIMKLEYNIHENHRESFYLSFITKRDEHLFYLTDSLGESLNSFLKLKDVINQKGSFQYDALGVTQEKYYKYFIKVIHGDTLFEYEKLPNTKYELGCLRSVSVIDGFGEFEIKGYGIIDKFYLDNNGSLPCR
ncbi:MAG: hypothetical protein NT150_05730 [Bacteroidetes bacterium]|nr:hypothetical protein [Bacteroidota bacterium]